MESDGMVNVCFGMGERQCREPTELGKSDVEGFVSSFVKSFVETFPQIFFPLFKLWFGFITTTVQRDAFAETNQSFQAGPRTTKLKARIKCSENETDRGMEMTILHTYQSSNRVHLNKSLYFRKLRIMCFVCFPNKLCKYYVLHYIILCNHMRRNHM